MDLLELAERAENAEGPDTKLDALIWCALNGKRYKDHWHSEYHGGTGVGFTEPPRRTVIVTKRAVEPVTASLDAALTLVPEGCLVAELSENWRSGLWRAQLIPRASEQLIAAFDAGETVGWDTYDSSENGRHNVATPALALCAAALRARAAQ